MSVLRIRDLHASIDGTPILRGVDLEVESGRVEVIMGPNGSGKSTLAHVLMGHPAYAVTAGSATLDGDELLGRPVHERAALGLYVAMQYPVEVPGVGFESVLREALSGRDGGAAGQLGSRLRTEAERVRLDVALLDRPLNVGFSGGEKKRAETVQLAVLAPKIAVLDEIDSGLDVDALRDVARRVEAMTTEDGLGVLAITHYARVRAELRADRIHVLMAGRIVASGGPELAEHLEESGYEGLAAELGVDELAVQGPEERQAGKGVAMDVQGPMTELGDL